jgi:MoaA/NifB/PqqE/SkfB family radical SAM enzyme
MKVSEKAYKNAILNLKECRDRSPILSSYPLKLYIEPTLACNLNCGYCYPPEYHSAKRIDMDMFYSLERQLFEHVCEVNLFLSGEPTLHEKFSEMLDVCARYPFITKFFTNLSYKNDPLLRKMVETGSWVNVSFDGIENNVFRKNSNVDQIIKNLNFLKSYQKDFKHKKFIIRIASVVSKHNVNSLCRLLDWASSMEIPEVMLGCMDVSKDLAEYELTGEDATLFEQAIYRADLLGIRISTPSHIGGVKLERTNNWNDFSISIDNYFPHFCEDCNPDVDNQFCPYPWIQAVIDSSGNVVSCCQRKISLGKFSPENDFIKDIWNNEAFQRIRSIEDYTTCKSPETSPCNMIKYSIWGGELRLDNIPEI